MTLFPMTADSLELLAAALRGVEAAWRDGFAYTKAGIMLDDLVAADERPRTLFEGDVGRRASGAADDGARRGQRKVREVHGGSGRAGLQTRLEDAGREPLTGLDDRLEEVPLVLAR